MKCLLEKLRITMALCKKTLWDQRLPSLFPGRCSACLENGQFRSPVRPLVLIRPENITRKGAAPGRYREGRESVRPRQDGATRAYANRGIEEEPS